MKQRNDSPITMRVNLPDGSHVEVVPGGEIECEEKIGGFTVLDEPEPEPKPVEDMTVKELRAHADEHGIDLGDAQRRDDILAAVKAASEQ